MDLSIILNHDDETEETKYIRNRLYEFNEENVPSVFEHINLLLKDNNGKIYGGLLAIHYWSCMYIDILCKQSCMTNI